MRISKATLNFRIQRAIINGNPLNPANPANVAFREQLARENGVKPVASPFGHGVAALEKLWAEEDAR